MKIIIDAMGGDNAPSEIVKGAVKAVEELGVEVILTGRGEDILRSLEEMGRRALPHGIEIVNASEIIEMKEDPVTVIRTKKDSSMVVGLKMLRDGMGNAMVSAGSTGALLSGATLIVKRINGIRRAALAPYIPNKGRGVVLIDCGANAECTPEYLLQFAFMGSYYARSVIDGENPRVGLLNIGVEATKGTDLQIKAYELLDEAGQKSRINFIGNVEAMDVLNGTCDVAVCDGFSGNILLKGIEGSASFLLSEIRAVFEKNWRTKLAALLVKKDVMSLREKMSAERIGGTALLGISKPVIKAHGSSEAGAIFGAIRQAMAAVEMNIAESIRNNIEYMKIDSGGDE